MEETKDKKRCGFKDRFALIWALETRFPLPESWWPKETVPGSKYVALIPLAGGILGVLTALLVCILSHYISPYAAAWLGAMFYALFGWGIHLDGWADVWDGIGSGKSGEELHAVIKDTKTGAFAIIGIVLALGTWTSLAAYIPIEKRFSAIVLAAVCGRFAEASACYFGKYPWENGLVDCVAAFDGGDFALALLCIVPFAFFALDYCAMSAMLCFVIGAMGASYMNKKMGGTNGDVLGAVEIFGELATLLVFAA